MILYKYFGPERAQILSERLIRFTPPGLFNDPFDCLPVVGPYTDESIKDLVSRVANIAAPPDLIKKAQATLVDRYTRDQNILRDQIVNHITQTINAEVGVLSLSSRNNSLVMWSHYSYCHTGFVVGFDSDDDFFAHGSDEPREIGELREITYSNERPTITPPFTGDAPNILFAKNDEWRYESEWRILRFLKDATTIRTAPVSNKQIHLFKVPARAIRQVILGRSTNENTTATLLNARANSELEHLEFYKAQLSLSCYDLDISPL